MYLFSSSVIFLFFLTHLCLLFIGAVIAYTQSNKTDFWGMSIVIASYITMNFFRTGFGVDEPVYLDAYQDFVRNGTEHFEYSFNFLYLIFSNLDVSTEFFNKMFSTTFILLVGFVVTICTCRPYRTLTLVFFLFFSITLDFVFNAYRQGMAFLFILLFLHFYNLGRRKKALVWFFIALGFHWSSIVVFLALFLRNFLSMRYTIRLNLILIIVTFIAAVIPLGIVNIIGDILSIVTLGSPYVTKIMMYLQSPVAYFYDLNMLGRLPLMIAVLSMLFIIYIYRHVIPKFYYKIIVILMTYCFVFLEMSYSFRNYYWVLPILPFLMANIPSYLNDSNKRKVSIIVMVSLHIALSITGYYTSGILPLIFV